MCEEGIIKNEKQVITFCSMCYHTLKKANQFIKDKDKLEKINAFLQEEKELAGGIKREYEGRIETLDFLEVLRDKIGYKEIFKRVKKPLKNLKVATYYGCLVLRPKEIGIDDMDNPTILESLLESLGAEIVNNPNRTQCCGSYHTVGNKDLVSKLTYDNLIYPIRNGAEIVVTCCPLCNFNLDFRQDEAEKIDSKFEKIPIMYYTQLMAIAFRLARKFYGIDFGLHHVDPKTILKNKNLIRK
jgi:heterodisulfide reductase subunit B